MYKYKTKPAWKLIETPTSHSCIKKSPNSNSSIFLGNVRRITPNQQYWGMPIVQVVAKRLKSLSRVSYNTAHYYISGEVMF
ncbi:hypothetical protein CHS0354_036891 [Potamilus streckersoni]|uniref:Uncharacterized protein n=1 Tax=Potamilus streckersoni TaxID=2493646 RepID=A0AAE0T2F4_9BIVA|nr:hypothetical protein CHS0354_036891 [Potamilus streckersoni]